MKCTKRIVGLLLAVALVSGIQPMSAAFTQGEVRVTLGDPDLSSFPDISLPVTVVNANGVPLLDLQAGNFEALEDDSPVTIREVATKENPDLTIAVALVLDLSGSAPIENVREAARQFLEHLGPNDRVALIGFNSPLDFDTFDPAKETDFTSDLDAVQAVVDELVAVGESAVYEAVYKGVLITAEEVADRRAVIVMTDGYDTASRPAIATADTPRTAAKERGIPVFTVGVYSPEFASDADYLNVLARETGGQYQAATDLTQLAALFQGVVEQLRTEYRITVQTDLEPDGRDHVLRVRTTTPQGAGEAERTITYPPLPPVPLILRLQRDVNGELQDLTASDELKGRVLLVPQISAENPLLRVEYYLDGVLAHVVDMEALRGQEQHEPWEWRCDTEHVEEGNHTLTIIAYDDAGNVSERFSVDVRVGRAAPTLFGVSLWVVVGIAAAVVFLALVIFLVLRRRPERCPDCGRAMDPSWEGVCQFCAAEGGALGPSGASAPLVEPPTAPQISVGQEPARVHTAAMEPGASSAAPPAPRTLKLRREPPVIGWLVVEEGSRVGQEFRLGEVTTIGRTGDNDVILDHTAVSRQHAKIRLEGTDFTIFDLGATNPTKVNGQEIAKHTLVDGDRVEIGDVVLVFKQIQPAQE
jgi:VWFA-related protein